MLGLILFAPFILLFALAILGALFGGARARGDKLMMKCWGMFFCIALILLGLSIKTLYDVSKSLT